ncbi:MAG TPA: M23 family metallopeptidase [Acidimicrobiia bacterium]|nr:M23 family metallopeptidase [Acidimicrobiia bacterium]
MSRPGRVLPALTKTLSVLIAAATLLPALPAAAAPEPPFQIEFPQETEPTEFTSSFGDGRSGGRRHTGNDLMAPKMTEVYAAADGIITVIATSSLAGRYIEIAHRDGWSTRYIHLNNDDIGTDNGGADWALTVVPGLRVGSRVMAGQHIGFVGDSGNAEGAGSHTHFELAYEGGEIDPYPYLTSAFSRAVEIRSRLDRMIVHPGEPNHVS